MGTTAYGGKGSKGRAANGDRPVGAASCRREHYTMASCQTPWGTVLPRYTHTPWGTETAKESELAMHKKCWCAEIVKVKTQGQIKASVSTI